MVWEVLTSTVLAGADARGLFRAVQAKGEGYAIATESELQFTVSVSRATGEDPHPHRESSGQHSRHVAVSSAFRRGRIARYRAHPQDNCLLYELFLCRLLEFLRHQS